MAIDLQVDLYPSEMKRLYERVIPELQVMASELQDRDVEFPERVRDLFAQYGFRAEVVGWDKMEKDGVPVTDADGRPVWSPDITLQGRIVEEIEHDYDRMQYETQAQNAMVTGNPDVRRRTSTAMPMTGKLWTPRGPRNGR